MTYWNHSGTYAELACALDKCNGKGAKLLRYVKAKGYYYRFYNDGDTSIGFCRIFGVTKHTLDLYATLEQAMDKIIVDAAIEQHLM